ncbi:MAG TPA: hypothetical protein VFQ00_11685, partial [Terriglobales bacterium]|nr:hypothetical protein [Terriglobales bacterium]
NMELAGTKEQPKRAGIAAKLDSGEKYREHQHFSAACEVVPFPESDFHCIFPKPLKSRRLSSESRSAL